MPSTYCKLHTNYLQCVPSGMLVSVFKTTQHKPREYHLNDHQYKILQVYYVCYT